MLSLCVCVGCVAGAGEVVTDGYLSLLILHFPHYDDRQRDFLVACWEGSEPAGTPPLHSPPPDLGFEYLQALCTGCEVYMTILHPPGVLVPEQALTEDLHALLTARSQPSDG